MDLQPESEFWPRLHQKGRGQQGEGWGKGFFPSTLLWWYLTWSAASSSGLLAQERCETFWNSSRGGHKNNKLGLFTLEKRKLLGDLITNFQYFKRLVKKGISSTLPRRLRTLEGLRLVFSHKTWRNKTLHAADSSMSFVTRSTSLLRNRSAFFIVLCFAPNIYIYKRLSCGFAFSLFSALV